MRNRGRISAVQHHLASPLLVTHTHESERKPSVTLLRWSMDLGGARALPSLKEALHPTWSTFLGASSRLTLVFFGCVHACMRSLFPSARSGETLRVRKYVRRAKEDKMRGSINPHAHMRLSVSLPLSIVDPSAISSCTRSDPRVQRRERTLCAQDNRLVAVRDIALDVPLRASAKRSKK